MNLALAWPVLLGTLVVFQPLLNRMIFDERGLSFAAWLNSVVLVTVATSVLLLCLYLGERCPEFLRPRMAGMIRWWYVVPGLLGLTLVLLVPLSMRQFGAFTTVLAMLVGQLGTSVVWDLVADGRPITPTRIAGLVCAGIGAYLSFKPAV